MCVNEKIYIFKKYKTITKLGCDVLYTKIMYSK